MKTELTLKLEKAIWKQVKKMGIFACHEVGIHNGRIIEIVDFLTYNTKHEWRCYEIKVTKSDFYSTAKKTFVGHYNYYVMPHELYLEVKQDIPSGIGVYVYKHNKYSDYVYCEKTARRRELVVPESTLIYSIIKSLSREYDKNMRKKD